MTAMIRAAAIALSCAALAGPATAAIKYDFSATGMGVASGATVTGSTVGPASGSAPGPDVTIRGVRGSSSGFLGWAPVQTWDGLGVAGDGGNPQHSTDNNGSYEAIALQFATAIALTDVSIGWYSSDSDMTVLAYTGAGTPTTTGVTWAGLTGTSGGWTLMGHYKNVHSQPDDNTSLRNDAATRGSPVSSSYWLIAAYNPEVGSGPIFNGGGLYQGNDYVKINGVAGFVSRDVTEPSVFALMGLGLLGLLGRGRRARA